MEDFWQIVRGWEPIGQGLFFLIVLGGFFALIKYIVYYISVGLRGWPPEHVNPPNPDEE